MRRRFAVVVVVVVAVVAVVVRMMRPLTDKYHGSRLSRNKNDKDEHCRSTLHR